MINEQFVQWLLMALIQAALNCENNTDASACSADVDYTATDAAASAAANG